MANPATVRLRNARLRAGAAALLMAAVFAPARAADVALPLSPPTPPEAVAQAAPMPAAPADSISLPPVPQLEQNFKPRPPRDLFEAQIALMRDAICPGSIDGVNGAQTRNAITAFQQKYGLNVSGELDNDTRAMLQLREPLLTTCTVTEADLARLRPWPKGWEAKSQLDHLDFSTVLELVAEKSWTNPKQILRLNPQITNWDAIQPGTVVAMPRVFRTQPSTRPMRILIQLSAKTMQLYDNESRLLAHFPCSIARRVEKRPVGRIEVVTSAPNPNYTFNPANFPDSEEAQTIGRKLILQPGPNNPVGVAWISLSLPGYGIHGSPEPEKIGRTESAGCFRLSNWNADYLLPLIYPGLAIDVEP